MKKIVKIFQKPSIGEALAAELDEAQRQLLEAETGKEYAESIVRYNIARIARLRNRIEEHATQVA
jgi:hypothetical protein